MPQITDKHKQFARAVVALAREHGANNLKLEFDFNSSKTFLSGDERGNMKTHFSWEEGRHGCGNDIIINASETVWLKELISSE